MIKLLKRIWNFRYRAVFYENGRFCWRVVEPSCAYIRRGGKVYRVVKTPTDIQLKNGLYAEEVEDLFK